LAEAFNTILIKLLKKDSRFIDEDGELVKSAVIDNAYKIDRQLVKLLLSDKQIKDKFFDEIENHWIFNINTFINFISDKNFLDNSYTRFRNKIGLTIDGKFLKERGEVCLVWPYKDCVLEGGQTKEEEKRKEIFFNEVLAQDEIDRLLDPKVLTNFKRFTPEGEKKVAELKRDENGTIRENLIIKGNNLLALHCLKKQFAGKVKLIYIDPPYNTSGAANTFGYNNSFNHSAWLTFMKNRLEIAKDFLSRDGIIVVAIDHCELFYLGVLLDEIFDRENRMGVCAVVHNPGGRQDDKFFPTAHENMLFYAKDVTLAQINKLGILEDKLSQFKLSDKYGNYKLRGFRRSGSNSRRVDRPKLFYPIYYDPKTSKLNLDKKKDAIELLPIDENGIERCWRWGPETFLKKAEKYIEVQKTKNGFELYVKERECDYEGEKAKTIWDKSKYTGQTGTNEIKIEFGSKVFSYPKSPFLIHDVLQITTNENDLVLDFFSGSGTTAAVAHKMGRQFIAIEQMDYTEDITVERLKKVIGKKIKKKDKFLDEIEFDEGGISKAVNWQGGGDFVYFELMKYNEVYMDKIQEAKTSKELVKIWKEIAENSFLNWYVNPELPDEAAKDFEDIGKSVNGLEKQKRLLCELLNKNQLYVNLTEIDDKQFNVSKEDKELNKAFYGEDY
jgi:adenine-specific DNA-methyltransferase